MEKSSKFSSLIMITSVSVWFKASIVETVWQNLWHHNHFAKVDFCIWRPLPHLPGCTPWSRAIGALHQTFCNSAPAFRNGINWVSQIILMIKVFLKFHDVIVLWKSYIARPLLFLRMSSSLRTSSSLTHLENISLQPWRPFSFCLLLSCSSVKLFQVRDGGK